MSWSSTGTGSGKTESFLYPIVDDLLRQRDQGITRGADGDPRLPDERPGQRPAGPPAGHARRHGHHLRPVGRHHAGEPRPMSAMDRFPGSGPASLPGRPPASAGRRPRPRTGPCGPWPRPRSAAPRKTSADRKPRILLTNYRQLEVLTTRLARRGALRRGPAQVPRLRRGPHLRRGHRGRGRLPGPPGAGPGREKAGRDHLHRHVGHPVRSRPRRTRTTTRRPAASPPGSSAWTPARSRWSASPMSAGSGRTSAIGPSPPTATAWPG